MLRRQVLRIGLAALAAPALIGRARAAESDRPGIRLSASYVALPGLKGPRGLIVGADGGLLIAGSGNATLGRFDPTSGELKTVALGEGATPQAVVQAPNGTIWLLDSAGNALIRVDGTGKVDRIALPEGRPKAELSSAVFDTAGRLWFTGRAGVYGRLDPDGLKIELKEAPAGSGPAGLALTPSGEVWFVTAAGEQIARIDTGTGNVMVMPLPDGAKGGFQMRSDARSRLWVTTQQPGGVSAYDTKGAGWTSWKLPGDLPRPTALYADDGDKLWVADAASNAIVHFDPVTEAFTALPSDRPGADVHAITGRAGEVWATESAHDRLVRIAVAKPA